MITATGNNFGAYTIQLKDYQSDKMVILNGRLELNPESEDYIAAKQLEIYVPDLSLPKSTMTAVFQHGKSWAKPMVTALKSWIKDKNTIVIEKPIVLRVRRPNRSWTSSAPTFRREYDSPRKA